MQSLDFSLEADVKILLAGTRQYQETVASRQRKHTKCMQRALKHNTVYKGNFQTNHTSVMVCNQEEANTL